MCCYQLFCPFGEKKGEFLPLKKKKKKKKNQPHLLEMGEAMCICSWEECKLSDGMTNCVLESLPRRTERKEEIIRPQSQRSHKGL